MLTLGQLGCSSILRPLRISKATAHRSSERPPASWAHLILIETLHSGPMKNINISKMFYHRQVLFSAVSSVRFSSRGLFGPCMTGQEGHWESLIKCGMNTERSLSLASQAMSLHLSFSHILLSSPLLLSNWEGANGDVLLSYATSINSLCQEQHTIAHWVGHIPLWGIWGIFRKHCTGPTWCRFKGIYMVIFCKQLLFQHYQQQF